MTDLLTVENLTHIYSPGTPFEKKALSDVSFSIGESEMTAVIGQTGRGKSTLIQHLNGILKPTSGRVLIHGEDIRSDKRLLRAARFAVGLVFQYPEYQLFEETVLKDISFGPKNMGLSNEETERRALEAAQIVGLSEDDLSKSPFELSGGQKRRVAIAGILAMEPQLLVLDEPTAGLDPRGREQIIGYIKNYREKHRTSVIFVTHSMEDAAENAQRLIVLHRGSILMQGTPFEVFERAEELKSAGLGVPKVCEVISELRSRGINLKTAFTPEAAASVIKGARARD
ncbi:MAG: energy-coupling factor transporter ATPase [Clostridia bacterium]|nr:energy-coupling factor transporter ATPase [Clostridia bacterium]